MIPRVVVLDFETLSTEHNAALLSIGAVIRDFNTGEQVDTFYANIIPQTSIDAGLDVSESTKAWWAKQGSAAQNVLSVDQRPLLDVLTDFAAWIKRHGVEYAIGNGPRADNQWLESACKALGMPSPVKYWGDLDMRTLTFIGTYILRLPHWHSTFKGVKHNALHDAINEAEFCNNVIQQLIKKESIKMAEYNLSIKTESTVELAEIVAKLNNGSLGAAIARTIEADNIVKEAIPAVADGQTHTTTLNTPTPTPVPTPAPAPEEDEGEQNNSAPNVDKNGLPWDSRIHAGTKALNADGTWKKRRGVDDATIAAVTAELTFTPTPFTVAETPAPTPAPQPETPVPAPTPAPVAAPTPAPAADVKQPIQQFQEIVGQIGEAGRAASPDYMPKFHGPLVQFLLKKSGVTQVPAATPDQMKAMYDVRDALIANMASITAGVPVETLVV